MRSFVLFVLVLFAVLHTTSQQSSSEAQATGKEIVRAINLARTNPREFKKTFDLFFTGDHSGGKSGLEAGGVRNCYAETRAFLEAQAGKTLEALKEDPGLDVAAYEGSKAMAV